MEIIEAVVISNRLVSPDVYELVVEGAWNIETWFSGQFVQVQVAKEAGYLRRPFSIVDMRGTELVMVYRLEGLGTRLMVNLKPGDTVSVLGPLGNTFPRVYQKRIAIIGGGIGVVPLYGLAKRLKEDNDVDLFMGYRTESAIIYQEEFEAIGTLTIATDDGTYGLRGSILDCVKEGDYDVIYACGPNGLLKAIQTKFKEEETYISMEARMACGYGVCNACVCEKTEESKTALICKDGPVFKGSEIKL